MQISACGHGGVWRVAFCVVAEMLASTTQLNTITIIAAIGACGNEGEWQVPWGVLAERPASTGNSSWHEACWLRWLGAQRSRTTVAVIAEGG